MTRQTDTRYIHTRLQTFADVRDALDDLCHRLSNDINDATKVAEIEIVLAEILNNIVEHGGTSAYQYPVEISWDIGTEIAFMIRDTGRPYPQLRLPAPDLPNCDDLPEGGFGWGVIQMICHAVSYQRVNGANLLRFSFGTETLKP